MTAYRIRLDTTTNWAVVTTAAIVSYSLGATSAPHFVLVLAVALNLLFAWIEARRYSNLEMIRARVRLLERGFYVSVLEGNPDPEWAVQLQKSLQTPVLPLRHLEAISVRLRRNYLGLITFVLIAWLLKLLVHGKGSLLEAASIPPIRGTVVLGGALLFVLGLGLLALRYRAPEDG